MNLTEQWLGDNVSYEAALQTQEDTLLEVLNGNQPDTYFTLEHAPVYTIGRTRDQSSLRDPSLLPHPTVEINRGGQATYHGPGQLVGYPIIDLKKLGKDLHTYIRAIEHSLVLACNEEFSIPATIRDGLTGVWVENRKLCSIGVGVRKWISMHGFAMNITNESLSGFQAITPCGIAGVVMTTISKEAGTNISVREFSEKHTPYLNQTLSALET